MLEDQRDPDTDEQSHQDPEHDLAAGGNPDRGLRKRREIHDVDLPDFRRFREPGLLIFVAQLIGDLPVRLLALEENRLLGVGGRDLHQRGRVLRLQSGK